MNGPFLGLTILAALLLVNWRLVLVALLASLIALIVLGLGVISPENVDAVGLPALTEPASAAVALGDDNLRTAR